MLYKVELVNRRNNHLAFEAIPRFNESPNVLLWCGRTFFLLRTCLPVPWGPHDGQPLTTYMEAFTVEIPEPEATAKAMGSKYTEIK